MPFLAPLIFESTATVAPCDEIWVRQTWFTVAAQYTISPEKVSHHAGGLWTGEIGGTEGDASERDALQDGYEVLMFYC
jgi:hypothetical protein